MMDASRGYRSLLAAVAVPLELARWTAVPIHARTFPSFTEAGESKREGKNAWKVQSDNAAGGYALLLPQGSYDKVQWRWKVTSFPKTASAPPFTKSNDDYAIRVGILLNQGDTAFQVPAPFQKLLDANHAKLSRVLFYLGVPGTPPSENCGVSPYRDEIGYCALGSGPAWTTHRADPRADSRKAFQLSSEEARKLRIIGLWIFSDSDNSSSAAQAELDGVQLFGETQK